MTQQITLYGKGGAGKTTIAANLAAALAEAGQRVLLVGCSPTADSSHLLLDAVHPLTIAAFLQTAVKPAAAELIATGYRGVGCIEAGDFHGHEACSARAVDSALQRLQELGVIERFAPEFVIYDLPGDLGCVGAIGRSERDRGLSLVATTASFQSLFAANRIIGALSRLPGSGAIALIANGSGCSFEDAFVADFARQVELPLAATIPRSLAVSFSELYGRTVIEAGPLSTHACSYRRLAKLVSEKKPVGSGRGKAAPLDPHCLKTWARQWGERLGELEFGIVADGAGI